AKLRVQMRSEIQKLHQRLQTTTIYVTHDQTEAMTMATSLVVMKDRVIQQVGAPKEVYDAPENVFVGGFIGSPAMNFLHGKLNENEFVIDSIKIKVPQGRMKTRRKQGYVGKDIILVIRPEDIHDERVFRESSPETKIPSVIDVAELMGAESYLYSKIDNREFIARVDSRTDVSGGDKIELALDMNEAHFFDEDSERRIK